MSEILKGVLDIAGSIIKSRRERKINKEISKISRQKEKEEKTTKIETKNEISKIETEVELGKLQLEVQPEKIISKENELIKKHLDKELKKYKSPLSSEMVFSASEEFKIPIEYIMAIMKNDSHYGTRGKGARTFNPGNVGNTDDGSTRNRGNRTDGVRSVARNLSRRTKEYKKVFGKKSNPTIRELVSNQGSKDKIGFLSNQANYEKPNPKRMGAYMTAEKGPDNIEKISNHIAESFPLA